MDKVKVENFDLKYKVLLKSHKNVDVSTLTVGMLCFSPCVCVCEMGSSCTRKCRN